MIKKNKIFTCSFLLFYSAVSLAQNKIIGTYYCFSSNDSVIRDAGTIKLLNKKNEIWHEFYDPTRASLVDTIINDTLIKSRQLRYRDTLVDRSGRYTFFKKRNRIYFKYFDLSAKKYYTHAAYPIGKGDTTKYVEIFSINPIVFGFISISGISWYERDTLIQDNRKVYHKCYVIGVMFDKRQHQKIYEAKIFIDKQSLIALQYNLFDNNNNLLHYYSIRVE